MIWRDGVRNNDLVLLTITTTRAPATDLGYLLHKHPDRLQGFPTVAGAAVTCFDHRRAGEVWYQKKEPSGPWYVFKSNPPKTDDEFAKLKPGNQIEAQLQSARATLGINQP